MKTHLVFGFAVLIALNIQTLIAQDRLAEVESLKPEIAEDVARAATRAKLKVDETLQSAFIDAASINTAAALEVYRTVPKEVRIIRLARYLAAKTPEGSDRSLIGADFHWGYVARDLQYSPMLFRSSQQAVLQSVESQGNSYVTYKGAVIRPGTTFVLPSGPGNEVGHGNVTAIFKFGDTQALWSGNPASRSEVYVPTARTTRGTEIFISSHPSGAIIYFNGRQWYQRTNTSSVRDPGTYEVVLQRDGYKEWRDKRSLTPGDTWTIDVTLEAN